MTLKTCGFIKMVLSVILRIKRRRILATKITPSDSLRFFLWKFVKSRTYSNNSTTIGELKTLIRHIIGEIKQQTWEKFIQNSLKEKECANRVVEANCILYAAIKI